MGVAPGKALVLPRPLLTTTYEGWAQNTTLSDRHEARWEARPFSLGAAANRLHDCLFSSDTEKQLRLLGGFSVLVQAATLR